MEEFSKKKSNPDGRYHICKECNRKIVNQRNQEKAKDRDDFFGSFI